MVASVAHASIAVRAAAVNLLPWRHLLVTSRARVPGLLREQRTLVASGAHASIAVRAAAVTVLPKKRNLLVTNRALELLFLTSLARYSSREAKKHKSSWKNRPLICSSSSCARCGILKVWSNNGQDTRSKNSKRMRHLVLLMNSRKPASRTMATKRQ